MKKILLSLGVLMAGSTFAQTINTFPYNEDFESEATCGTGAATPCPLSTTGWFNAGGDGIDWTVDINGTGSANTGPTANGGADHAPGVAGGKYLYTESSATGGNPNIVAWLESPWFNFTALTAPELAFWYHMFGTSMGTMQVDARVGVNGAWTMVGPAPWTDNIDLWQERNISLVAYAGMDSVQIRIHGITGTSFGSDMAIDDVSVFEPAAIDFELLSIDSPLSGCGLGMEDVTLCVQQLGSVGPIAGDTLFLSFDNGVTTIIDTVVLVAPMGYEDTLCVLLSQQADFSAIGSYAMTASVYNYQDPDGANDTLLGNLNNSQLVNTFPYLETFEAGQGSWVIDNNVNGNWEFGQPAGAIINSAQSGDSCFVTSLTGNYNANSNSWVESPCFDMTQANGDEFFTVDVFRETEDSWDGMNVTYTMDAGATWNLLGNFGDPDWYTDNSINGTPGGSQEGWEGSSNGWEQSKLELPDTIFTSSDVKFRFNFGSDGSVQQEGIAFDNVAIASPFVYDVYADTVVVCDTLFSGDAGSGWDLYEWSTGMTTQMDTLVGDGQYWIEVTDSFGVCARDSVYLIFQNVIPPNLANQVVICNPDSTTLDAGADTNNVYSYLWNTGDTTQMITTNMGGSYSVIKTDSSGFCINMDTIQVIVPDTAQLGAPTIGYCTGMFPVLDANVSGATYLWNTSATTQTITPTAAGAYSVTVIDTNNCISIDAVNIVESVPTVNLGEDLTICVNHTITLDAGTQDTYLWSDSSTGQTVLVDGSVLGAGTYTYSVVVSDSIGCTATDDIIVTVDACTNVEELENIDMSIFPNPSTGVFTYTLNEFKGDVTMIITDVTGKVVMSDLITAAQGEIDLTQFERGVYIMSLSFDNKKASLRLIKQ